jgi:hypothetical protein
MDFDRVFGLKPFTRAEAMSAGLTKRQWSRAKQCLVRMSRGVYLVRWGPDSRTRHAQRAAAALAGKTRHFACSGSAACILGLPNPYFRSWDDVPVSIAGPQTRSTRGIRRRVGTVACTPWGPCSDLIDTAVAMSEELPLPQALMITDAAARRLAGTDNRFTLASKECREEVRDRLTRTAELDALRLADPAADSPPESFYRGHMLLAGFPYPRVGAPYRGTSGSQYFIDMLLGRLAIEIDGWVKYTDAHVLRREKTREDDLRPALDFLPA